MKQIFSIASHILRYIKKVMCPFYPKWDNMRCLLNFLKILFLSRYHKHNFLSKYSPFKIMFHRTTDSYSGTNSTSFSITIMLAFKLHNIEISNSAFHDKANKNLKTANTEIGQTK